MFQLPFSLCSFLEPKNILYIQEIFFKTVEFQEDDLIISLLQFFTAFAEQRDESVFSSNTENPNNFNINYQPSFEVKNRTFNKSFVKNLIFYNKIKPLKIQFVDSLFEDEKNFGRFLPKIMELLQYQKSDRVVIATCHFLYSVCNRNLKIQKIMIGPEWTLQEKIRPVLRNYKTSVKIAAIRATWALSTGQAANCQRRIAAKFGIREINRMLLSSSMNKKDEGESVENIQRLQMLGLTILRAYCSRWPSGQVICSTPATLINLRQLLIIFMIPGKSSPRFQILLLKTLRDLLSLDGCFLVNSKVREIIIENGIPSYLIAIYENYADQFLMIDPEITLLMIQLINFLNEPKKFKDNTGSRAEQILNSTLVNCMRMKEFKTVISLAHFSTLRSNMIRLNWFYDILPCFEDYQKKAEYKKLSNLIAFVIFCSGRIEQIDVTEAVAYACQKLFEMASQENHRAIKYSSRIISILPMIGVNYLNALARNGFIELFLDHLDTLDSKFSELNNQEFQNVRDLLISAITTFTVDSCGRRLILCQLRKKSHLIERILTAVTPDYSFWNDVVESLGQDDIEPDHKILAVPELCTNMDTDFMVNLKFLQSRQSTFDSIQRKFSRQVDRLGMGRRAHTALGSYERPISRVFAREGNYKAELDAMSNSTFSIRNSHNSNGKKEMKSYDYQIRKQFKGKIINDVSSTYKNVPATSQDLTKTRGFRSSTAIPGVRIGNISKICDKFSPEYNLLPGRRQVSNNKIVLKGKV